MVLFITGFLALVGINVSENQRSQRTELVQHVAQQVQEEIRIADTASDGYERTLLLPNNILGDDYALDIIDDLLQVRTLDGKNSIALPIANVTGTLSPGANMLRKNNGHVYANS